MGSVFKCLMVSSWIGLTLTIILTTLCLNVHGQLQDNGQSGLYKFLKISPSDPEIHERSKRGFSLSQMYEGVKDATFSFFDRVKSSVSNIFAHHHHHGNNKRPATHTLEYHQNDKDRGRVFMDNKEHGRFDVLGARDLIRNVLGGDQNDGKEKESDKDSSSWKAIYPGTLWCGDGTKARDYNDLGDFWLTDSCCREHDNCEDIIPRGGTKYGLINTGLFTRSHCDCDMKFYNCLKGANTLVSKQIGHTYFTLLGPQCFKEDFPIILCADSSLGKCNSYVTDSSKERRYQWFDSPIF